MVAEPTTIQAPPATDGLFIGETPVIAPPRPMTEEEFVAWSATTEKGVRAEFVDGEIIIMGPDTGVSQDLRWFLGCSLLDLAERDDLGRLLGPMFLCRLRPG